MRNGHTSGTNSSMRTPAIPQVTYMTMPTGGVIRPIIRLRTMTTPKWMGSIPYWRIRGARIGVRMKMIGGESMMQPSMRRKTFRMTRSRVGLSVIERKKPARAWELLHRRDPAAERGRGEDQPDRRRGRGDVEQHLPELPERQLAVEEAQRQGVGDRHDRGFRRGEKPRKMPPRMMTGVSIGRRPSRIARPRRPSENGACRP